MTSLIFDPFEEFQQFLAKLSFEELVKNKDFVATSKKVHKRALALLIVEHQFEIELKDAPTELEIASISFLNEFRSDLLSSLIVFHIGLYKASMMTARSSLENLFRVIAGVQGLDFRNCKSVSDLIDLIKTAPLRKSNPTFASGLGVLLTKYVDLCNYVHSRGDEFLSNDRKLGDMPRWVPDAGGACAISLVKMFQAAACVLLTLKPTGVCLIDAQTNCFACP
jgi:hypothetical protein